MIGQLLNALQALKLEFSAEEAADMLWLATRITPEAAPSDIHPPFTTPPSDTTKPLEPTTSTEQQPPSPLSILTEEPAGEGGGTARLYDRTARRAAVQPGMGATPFRAPAASALPGVLEISRALRPLLRRTPSPWLATLDEDGTARQIAETGLRIARTSPASERLFDVALIIDESASTSIWRQTVRELQRLLERQGAFGQLRTWWLDTNQGSNVVQLYAQPREVVGRQSVAARSLIDPTRRKLYLLVTDCVAPAWHTGTVTRTLIAPWGQTGVVSILQLLPQRLWRRTALGAASSVRLRAPTAGTPNRGLLTQENDLAPEQVLPVPIVTFEPAWLRTWARALTAAPNTWTSGRLLPLGEQPLRTQHRAQPASDDPDLLLKDFRKVASPTAQRLAQLLSVLPRSSLAVMRLIRETMLPEARQVHIAEVFLSGMLQLEAPGHEALDPENEQYEFLPGVADRLARLVTANTTLDVLETLSGFVEQRSGQVLDFRALLADPEADGHLVVSEELQPFAEISAGALRRFGGRFAQIAEHLTAGGGTGGVVRRVLRPAQPHPAYETPPPEVPAEVLEQARQLRAQLAHSETLPPILTTPPPGPQVPFQPHERRGMTQVEKLRIFLGSPSDVTTERKRVGEVIAELNQTLAPSLGVVLELTTSSNAFPGFGKDGQAIISEQIGDMRTYDLFVAIFWNRIGTPTTRDISGTVEEFKRALRALQANKKPDIWLYFSNAPANLSTPEALEQKRGVIDFRNSVRKKGLRKEYENPRDFVTQFRMHLTKWLHERGAKKRKPATPKEGPRKTQPQGLVAAPPEAETAAATSAKPPAKRLPAREKTGATTGTTRAAGSVKNPDTWVMLNNAFFRADSTAVQADRRIVLKITPPSLEEADALRSFQPTEFGGGANVSYADRHEAGTARVQSVTSESRGNKTAFTVTLGPLAATQHSSVISEFSFNEYSADDIAKYRARYILLGEPPPGRIESIVSAYQQRGSLGRSHRELPDTLPRLWAVLRTDIRSFPYKAWLFAVFLLKTRGIVESVTTMELGRLKSGIMKVKFQGRRRTYPGQEAVVIKVEGDCRLEL